MSARTDRADLISAAAVAVLCFFFLVGFVRCEMWQYDECLKVGHSTTYCLYQRGCNNERR